MLHPPRRAVRRQRATHVHAGGGRKPRGQAAEPFLAALRRVVDGSPRAIAILCGGQVALTYEELYARSVRLGAGLVQRGLGRNEIVGLCLPRSAEHVLSMLGVWHAGAAFLPLDRTLPRERLAFMIDDARPAMVIADESTRACVEGLGAPMVDVSTLSSSPLSPRPWAGPDELAYVIYTSGSMGRPKGVLVPHRGITSLLRAQIEAFALRGGCRSLLLLSLSFDASISDIGTTLLAGATLCIEPDEALTPVGLVDLLARRSITHLDVPPALLSHFDPAVLPPSLETLVIGGEVCPPAVVRRFAQRRRVVNVYGPTEATVCSSLAVCDPTTWTRALIGAPLPGVRYDIVDDALRSLPTGVAGELCIAGVGLALGYLGQGELTAAAFVERSGERWYRSGDRVLAHEDGGVEILGRLDRQVKLRGRRIEPEEIEACLRLHDDVMEAAVVQRRLRWREALVAFVVPRNGAGPSPADLRVHLSRHLPPWMLPQRIALLPSLPRLPAGKIDLAALRVHALKSAPVAEPAGDLLRTLARVCRRALDLDAVAIDEDVLEIGGDSMAVIEMAAGAVAQGVPLTPALILEHRTLRRMAHAMARSGAHEERATEKSASWLRDDVKLDDSLCALLARASQRPSASRAPHTRLITGATGLLGARLVMELLARTSAQLVCLVRATHDADARARLDTALAPLGVAWDRQRVRVIAGAIEAEHLGVSESTFRSLADDVDEVHHCAANVNLLLPYAALRQDNVVGTQEIARLLCAGREKRLHHASTLSVFVATDRSRGLHAEHDGLDDTRVVHGGYAQSKWAAEVFLRSLKGRSGPVDIYRLGLLTGDAHTGAGASNDLLSLFVRGTAALGVVPDAGLELRLDVTPVDFAARALAVLSLRAPVDGRDGRCFHVASRAGVPLHDVVDSMVALGIGVRVVTVDAWREAARAHLEGQARPDAAIALAYFALCRCLGDDEAFACHRSFDLFQATAATFDLERTERALAEAGMARSTPSVELLHAHLRRVLVAGSP